MRDWFGLVGAGGFGRGVMPLVRRAEGAFIDLCFVDRGRQGAVNGVPLVDEEEFLASSRPRWFNVAIADARLRQRISERYIAAGCRPRTIACSSAMIFDDVEIGEGAILCGNTMVTSNIRIGRYFHCNIYSYVEHDCVIGDYVTFAPGVRCNGNVVIGDHAYIGAGAMLRDGRPGKPLTIGAGAVVGMGAVVVADVRPGEVVAGNPARPLVRRLSA